MQKIDLASVPKRKERVESREFGTEAILLNLVSGDYLQISASGFEIWKHIDGYKTVEDIARELAIDFDAEPQDLADGAAEFIDQLVRKDFLSISR